MGSARKILVVDDDPKTVSLVKLYLESDGHKVVCAYDGVEALRLAREERPNLIVLDLRPPATESLGRGPAQAVHGDLSMYFRQHTVAIAGRPVALTPTEFRLLGTLVREAGQGRQR